MDADYLRRWYDAEKAKRSPTAPPYEVLTPEQLRYWVRPYFNAPAEWLTATRVGVDARKMPFLTRKRKASGMVYAVDWTKYTPTP